MKVVTKILIISILVISSCKDDDVGPAESFSFKFNDIVFRNDDPDALFHPDGSFEMIAGLSISESGDKKSIRFLIWGIYH